MKALKQGDNMKIIKKTLFTMIAAVPLTCNAALIETEGFGVDYQLGTTFGAIFDVEQGGVSSVFRAEEIGSQEFVTRTAKVRGDLSTGSIGAESVLIPKAPTSSGATNAAIKIVDTLTFDLTNHVPGNSFDLAIDLDWEGILYPYLSNRGSGASLSFSLKSDDDELTLNTRVTADTFLLSALNPGFQAGDPLKFGDIGFRSGLPAVIGDWNPTTAPFNEFSGLFSVLTGKVTEVVFSMRMNAFGNADFFNSAHIDLDSPVSYSSASGTFLTSGTQPPSTSVPTPTSGILMLSGLVGLMLRRRLS